VVCVVCVVCVVLHGVRSSVLSFIFQYYYFRLSSSSSFLHLLHRVALTSTLSSNFFPITYFKSQFLRQMWLIHLVFLLFICCRIFFSSMNLCNTLFLIRSVQLTSSIFLQHNILKLSRYLNPTLRTKYNYRNFTGI